MDPRSHGPIRALTGSGTPVAVRKLMYRQFFPFAAWVNRNSAAILIVWALVGMLCLISWCALP